MWFISNFYPVSSFKTQKNQASIIIQKIIAFIVVRKVHAALVKSQCSLPYLLEQHDEYLWQNFEVALEVAVQIFLHLPDI